MELILTIIAGIIGAATALFGWIKSRENKTVVLFEHYEKRVNALDERLNKCEIECGARDKRIKRLNEKHDKLTVEIQELTSVITRIDQQNINAVVIADKSGKIVEWSPAATALFKYTSNQAIGQNVTLLIPTG